MKLIRYSTADSTGWGTLDGMQVRALPAFAFDEPLPHATRQFAASEVRWLLAPIVPRRNVFCLGRNYTDHVKELPTGSGEPPPTPVWFTKVTTAVNDPDADVRIDGTLTSQLDYEVELGVVMARGGRAIPEWSALDYVYGYTVVNDLSARDLQYGRGGQYFLGKSLDGCCPVGPCIVTTDEIGDPQNLTLSLRVNGVERQRANTRDMIVGVAAAIADLSKYISLLPGDLIATGTPAGTGIGMDPQVFLQDGDVVEAEIEKIGILRNRIVVSV